MKGLEVGRWDKAWGGIASLSLALSIVFTDASRHGYTLDHLVRWLCAAPARLAGFEDRAGALLPGREANFVIFDPEASRTIMVDDLHFRHPVSPYVGQTLAGRVHATYLRGEPVYRAHRGGAAAEGFTQKPTGRELRAQPSLNDILIHRQVPLGAYEYKRPTIA